MPDEPRFDRTSAAADHIAQELVALILLARRHGLTLLDYYCEVARVQAISEGEKARQAERSRS